MAEPVDLNFLGRLIQQTLDEVSDLRREVREQRQLSLTTVDYLRRLEKQFDARFVALEARMAALETRVAAIPDDMELMLKSELLGRLAHRDTVMDEKLEQLADRIAALEARG